MENQNYIMTETNIDSGNGYSYTTYTAATTKFTPKFSGAFKVLEEDSSFMTYKNVYIKEVIYNNPATIVFWSDNTKTISKCAEGDIYSPETGLAICVLKKLNSPTAIHDLFADWLPVTGNRVSLKNVRNKQNNESI